MHLRIYFAAFLVLTYIAVSFQNSMAYDRALSSSLSAQDSPKPDRWRGLVLDEATPEEAFSILGRAEKDNVDRLRVFYLSSKWITKKHKEKVFRTIRWKENKGLNPSVKGIKYVQLSFLNNKLAMIEFEVKEKIDASALENIYQIQFDPRIDGIDEAFNPQNFERMQGRVYPKIYPTVYYLQSATENSFLGVLVDNASMGAVLKNVTGVKDSPGNGFPGKIANFQIVTRRLENRDGEDALK